MADNEPDALVGACDVCRKRIERDGDLVNALGDPEVLTRKADMRFVHEEVELRPSMSDAVVALIPVEGSDRPHWIGVLASGEVVSVDGHGEVVRRAKLSDRLGLDISVRSWLSGVLTQAERGSLGSESQRLHPMLDVAARTRDQTDLAQAARYWALQRQLKNEVGFLVRVSADGRLAVICQRRGLRGVVFDLASGDIAMQISREDHHVWACTFPVCFVPHAGVQALVHARSWNRLDVTDPLTDQDLTPRPRGPIAEGELPSHHLDYFHGALTASPSGAWISDDGWTWHPWGRVTTWSVRRWLSDNVWESEDGRTKRYLANASYFWDRATCWIDEETVAIYGYGEDDDWMIPAARIYDVVSGEELRWFPGPSGDFYYDRFLYSVDRGSGGGGTSVWDVTTGERLHHDAAFLPQAHHRVSGSFLTIRRPDLAIISRVAQSGD